MLKMGRKSISFTLKHDFILIGSAVALLSLGLIMVASSSIMVADRQLGRPFYYVIHQSFALSLGIFCAFIVCALPMKFWYRLSTLMMFGALILLSLVLIPGIGRVANGSARWINFGFLGFQVSEFSKLTIVIYIASYIVRHPEALKHQISGFIRPMLLLSVVGALLILEPDFGATVVIIATALGMLFLAGVPLWQFIILLLIVVLVLGVAAVSAPYRLERLTSFLDPWSVQFDSGYQLTQALIAFGRGEWLGVGLGGGVQKLLYLPESHTDFIFAVLAEELGLLGALLTLSLYTVFVWRGMMIGLNAQMREAHFGAYVSYGISLWVGFQTLINLGVNTGVLPTKGLTLPFLSYGGSSILMICIAVGLLIRVDYENRLRSGETSFGRAAI